MGSVSGWDLGLGLRRSPEFGAGRSSSIRKSAHAGSAVRFGPRQTDASVNKNTAPLWGDQGDDPAEPRRPRYFNRGALIKMGDPNKKTIRAVLNQLKLSDRSSFDMPQVAETML